MHTLACSLCLCDSVSECQCGITSAVCKQGMLMWQQSISIHILCLLDSSEESTDNVYEISGNAEFERNKLFNAVMEHTKVQTLERSNTLIVVMWCSKWTRCAVKSAMQPSTAALIVSDNMHSFIRELANVPSSSPNLLQKLQES